jgi:hypothetical protein
MHVFVLQQHYLAKKVPANRKPSLHKLTAIQQIKANRYCTRTADDKNCCNTNQLLQPATAWPQYNYALREM